MVPIRMAMKVLDAGRIGIAAQAVGIARAAYEASVEYAKDRQAFGSAIGAFQMIQAKIADMKMRLDAARLLTYEACRLKDAGESYGQMAAMAKLHASETAMFVTDKAIQILGGAGYTKDMPVERLLRDAKLCEIGEGTSEVQRILIARAEAERRSA